MTINPTTLVVSFGDPIPSDPEPQTDFYWPFYDASGDCSISHYDTTTKHQPRIRYNSLDLDSHMKLRGRSKNQVVLQGEFGTFYADITYSYATTPTGGNAETMFDVHADTNDVEGEPPQVSDSPPPGNMRPDVVSILRVFSTPAGPQLVAACYTSEGEPLSASENQSIGGTRGSGGSISFGPLQDELTRLGLPVRFPFEAYAPGRSDLFTSYGRASILDCVTFHYGRNRLSRQDIFRPSEPVRTHTLTYKVTAEDAALEAIDEKQPFYRPPQPTHP